MDLYNKQRESFNSLISGCEIKKWAYSRAEVCRTLDRSPLILSRDSAYEFGGSALPAVSSTLFVCGEQGDEVFLIGKDIGELSSDSPYARIAIVSLKSEAFSDGDGIYRELKDTEFAKYRFFPENVMLRLSPESRREQMKVSKQALESGLSFKNIGFGFIDEYKKNKNVEGVRLYFITQKDFDYKALSSLATQVYTVTESLNRIFDGMEISCDTCELKAICDEVEGLRELHFGKERKKS